jgi:hypothetical protein
MAAVAGEAARLELDVDVGGLWAPPATRSSPTASSWAPLAP